VVVVVLLILKIKQEFLVDQVVVLHILLLQMFKVLLAKEIMAVVVHQIIIKQVVAVVLGLLVAMRELEAIMHQVALVEMV
jgi:hypothetical protein